MQLDQSRTLHGRRALVTGAGRGIGRSIALALATAGADVAVTARSTDELAQVAQEIEGLQRRGLPITCDVTDAHAVDHMVAEAADKLGGIDILVNNAGSAGSHKLLGHPDELWHRMLAINLTSVYYVTKAVVPYMIMQRQGRIITIASIAAKTGAHYVAAYTAAKHGVLGLTRALAVELVGYNIAVNAVCPGYVDTAMTEESVENIIARTGMSADVARAMLAQTNPQHRLIAPAEIAALVLYLAQDISLGITGQAINIDGGAVMY